MEAERKIPESCLNHKTFMKHSSLAEASRQLKHCEGRKMENL